MSFLRDHSREIGIVAVGFGLSYVLYSKISPFFGTIGASFTFMYMSSVLVPLEEPEKLLLVLAQS